MYACMYTYVPYTVYMQAPMHAAVGCDYNNNYEHQRGDSMCNPQLTGLGIHAQNDYDISIITMKYDML
jgi:hypothetical protein